MFKNLEFVAIVGYILRLMKKYYVKKIKDNPTFRKHAEEAEDKIADFVGKAYVKVVTLIIKILKSVYRRLMNIIIKIKAKFE